MTEVCPQMTFKHTCTEIYKHFTENSGTTIAQLRTVSVRNGSGVG